MHVTQNNHIRYGLGNRVEIQNIQAGNFRGCQLAFFQQGSFFAVAEYLLTGGGNIDIQHQKHNKGNYHISQGVTEMGALSLHRGNGPQFPFLTF